MQTPSGRPLAIVLSALPGPALAGRVVGLAEVVDTGERVHMKSADDLIALLRRLASEAAPES